jgi:hypothetical protein
MEINITDIVIVERKYGPDLVSLNTNLPPTRGGNAPACFDMRITRGKGAEYVKTNFPGIPYEIIKA